MKLEEVTKAAEQGAVVPAHAHGDNLPVQDIGSYHAAREGKLDYSLELTDVNTPSVIIRRAGRGGGEKMREIIFPWKADGQRRVGQGLLRLRT